MKNVPNHQPELVWKVPDLFELPKCIQRQPPHFGDRQRENNMVLPRPAFRTGCRLQIPSTRSTEVRFGEEKAGYVQSLALDPSRCDHFMYMRVQI